MSISKNRAGIEEPFFKEKLVTKKEVDREIEIVVDSVAPKLKLKIYTIELDWFLSWLEFKSRLNLIYNECIYLQYFFWIVDGVNTIDISIEACNRSKLFFVWLLMGDDVQGDP